MVFWETNAKKEKKKKSRHGVHFVRSEKKKKTKNVIRSLDAFAKGHLGDEFWISRKTHVHTPKRKVHKMTLSLSYLVTLITFVIAQHQKKVKLIVQTALVRRHRHSRGLSNPKIKIPSPSLFPSWFDGHSYHAPGNMLNNIDRCMFLRESHAKKNRAPWRYHFRMLRNKEICMLPRITW